MKKIIISIFILIIFLCGCLYVQLLTIDATRHQLTTVKKNIVYQSTIEDSEED
jgi:PBP1b-binding outer membrane lipoprotein LpoB